MPYSAFYASPLGDMAMRSEDGESLSVLSFYDDDVEAQAPQELKPDLPLFAEVKRWLDIYFSGSPPPFTPPLSLLGSEFQRAVWKEAMKIPYGKTASYGEIARRLSKEKKLAVSARAAGAALARNPIALIAPCHRVLGANGALKGYKWGVDRKQALLAREAITALPLSSLSPILTKSFNIYIFIA